jgi:hypothetical protein
MLPAALISTQLRNKQCSSSRHNGKGQWSGTTAPPGQHLHYDKPAPTFLGMLNLFDL